ncbi:dermokine [Kogia breviceps]|uniref:dermokine n=1 Tax=Kogia breviceps TaxID=27615 RepID=UPI0034D1FD8A
MKLQGSLACLLLVLCLGGGEAGPLLGGGESAGGGAMEATGHRVGEAIKHGVGEATGGGDGEAAGSAVKEAPGPGLGDAVARGVEEAAHALGNTGSEAGTQAENVIQHGVDAVHSSRQATPGDSGALVTVAHPPYGSGRGSANPNAEGSSGNGSSSGGSSGGSSGSSSGSRGGSGGNKPEGQGSSGGGEAVNGTNTLVTPASPRHPCLQVLPRAHSVGSYSHPISRRSSGLFNFDTFWKNLKSMLGFSNWDAINKGRVPDPRTGILLCFRQLWENFIRNIPFLNWKAIFKNYDYNQQIHPTATGGQHSATIPTKEGVTISSSASRARPDLLQWVQFW